MPRIELAIETRDGRCSALLFTPAGRGPWPGVIFCMDAFGVRPAMETMAQALADAGHAVLLPDLFYRMAPLPALNPAQVFADRTQLQELMRRVGSLDRARKLTDTAAFLDCLDDRPEVAGPRYGIVGYCMGGNFALTAAGAFPDRFAAIASFHGGNLASEAEDSPHRYVRGIRGRVYVAGAIEDASFPPEQKERLERALVEADVPHVVETYAGARHGFAVTDNPAFDPAAAERHWQALLKLFGETLAA
jgi:carboxymethylenebutenolidase